MTFPDSGAVDAFALTARYKTVQARLDDAIRSAGRRPEDVTLVAVSKFHPAAAIAALVAAGQRDFGENYVQESLRKQQDLQDLPVRWHFIGHLQTNKAREVAGRFDLMHTVGSLRLAQSLQKSMERVRTLQPAHATPAVQDILLQVNIGDEPQKSGVDVEELPVLADAVLELPALRLVGLMCLPPFFDDGEAARPFFARLRELRDGLERRTGMALPHLSMGMSGDFVQAVQEGATIVRIGTDIFGERPARV